MIDGENELYIPHSFLELLRARLSGVNDKSFHFVSVLISDAKVAVVPQPAVINISAAVDDFSENVYFCG